MADETEDLPKVVGGRLTKPYPIRTRGDVNKARVLPPPVDDEPRAATPVQKRAPAAVDEQPKGVLDNIVKRRNLMKTMGIRGKARRGGPRVSRA